MGIQRLDLTDPKKDMEYQLKEQLIQKIGNKPSDKLTQLEKDELLLTLAKLHGLIE